MIDTLSHISAIWVLVLSVTPYIIRRIFLEKTVGLDWKMQKLLVLSPCCTIRKSFESTDMFSLTWVSCLFTREHFDDLRKLTWRFLERLTASAWRSALGGQDDCSYCDQSHVIRSDASRKLCHLWKNKISRPQNENGWNRRYAIGHNWQDFKVVYTDVFERRSKHRKCRILRTFSRIRVQVPRILPFREPLPLNQLPLKSKLCL